MEKCESSQPFNYLLPSTSLLLDLGWTRSSSASSSSSSTTSRQQWSPPRMPDSSTQGFQVFDGREMPAFSLEFPLPAYPVAPGPPEASRWRAQLHNTPEDLFSAIAYSLEANDFYDFSRDPFALFYERHYQLRRAATQVLILMSRYADRQQKEELIKLTNGHFPEDETGEHSQNINLEKHARMMTAFDTEWISPAEIQALAIYLYRPIAVVMAAEEEGHQNEQQQSDGNVHQTKEEMVQIYLPDLKRKRHYIPANGLQQLWTLYSNPVVVYHEGNYQFRSVYCREQKKAEPDMAEGVFPEFLTAVNNQRRRVTGTKLVDVDTGDGNSMFRAIALSLSESSKWKAGDFVHRQLRQKAAIMMHRMSRGISGEELEALARIIAGQWPSFQSDAVEHGWMAKTMEIAGISSQQQRQWDLQRVRPEQLARKLQEHLNKRQLDILSQNVHTFWCSTIERYAQEMTAVDGARAGAGELQVLAAYLDRNIVVIHAESLTKTVYVPDKPEPQEIPKGDPKQWKDLWIHYQYQQTAEPIVLYKEGVNHYQAVIGTEQSVLASLFCCSGAKRWCCS